ncbi:CCA tRNA nucleotidyltransferase, mitochondrial [Aspergillus melleus]|uniref:CCA tRNA nucleotidyltransferase, mitochondrial n=1 Tax=Aspergillus melleus TaxID=138277 RepID=A0ACC3B9L3_9EURO|nr:CCA tRNA nucleotidyltransferase, mitochondrial [Aspergillus melleus]
MTSSESSNTSPKRANKRRRISNPTPRKSTRNSMAGTTDHALPVINLTPLEDTLKTLLLDVAEYAREKAIRDGANDADLPRTVLRFTGGWVRDKLLGVDSHDIDVAINTMTGYQFGLILKKYLDKPKRLDKYKQKLAKSGTTNHIGKLHKIDANPEKSKHLETVTTKIFGLDIDFVNLRKEVYTDDSRNPQMEFGTAEEDAVRRDATINALFYNLNESKVEDLTGSGLDDMKKKIIRTPLEPYQTFKDDPLRVLRLIRFASRLGYSIDESTAKAMQTNEISEALKLKISKERVGKELNGMLQGPDPRGALELIDRYGLYPTIFANHQDDACADTSTWSLSYNTLATLLFSQDFSASVGKVRNMLIRDTSEAYYAWIVAAFAPWSVVPGRVPTGPKPKPIPPRPAEVARDSLRSDNKTMAILSDATHNWRSIIDLKSSLVGGRMNGTDAENRQHIGLHVRSWRKDWRLCIVLSLLQEVMQGGEFSQVIQDYDKFLTYIVDHNLQDVWEMKPIVNGKEIFEHLKMPKGPWMTKAVEMVVEWQLLHPECTDKEKALENLSARKGEL